tara:strand:- start:3387 stop:3773 length:387 start_codon:yes stop_codon:yes gene_type:complete
MRYANTPDLAQLFGIHAFSVSKAFAPAYVARRFDGKIYDLEKVAAIITQASGHELTAEDLPDLVRRSKAIQMLAELGVQRSLRAWCYWAAEGQGPRVFLIGKRAYYLRPEVIAWGERLALCRRGFVPR